MVNANSLNYLFFFFQNVIIDHCVIVINVIVDTFFFGYGGTRVIQRFQVGCFDLSYLAITQQCTKNYSKHLATTQQHPGIMSLAFIWASSTHLYPCKCYLSLDGFSQKDPDCCRECVSNNQLTDLSCSLDVLSCFLDKGVL